MERVTTGLLLACLVLTAGCTGMSLGDDRMVFDSGETVVDGAAADEAGYELLGANAEELNRTVTVGGRNVTVAARSYVVVYGKAGGADGRTAAAAGIITMPDASVAGRSLNPPVGMNESQLIEEFVAEQGSANFEVRDRYAVETLGGEANVTVYASLSEEGEPQAFVHLLRDSPAGADDTVVAYATYPTADHDTERDDVRRLLASLKHTPPGESTDRSTDEP
jgi:hypothetical protein